jgi:putative ubiquitin-RnfH superfamily antitoxin RatB of RatAB toxin-antitoxin module
MASEGLIDITLVYSPRAREVLDLPLQLPIGSTVWQAVQASGLLTGGYVLEPTGLTVGIWGRKVALDQRLSHQDRVEIYRPLKVDPKVARRERFARQGSRSAGLFTQKRPGAKAGY